MKINTNISALRANFNLNSVQSQLTASTNKLSSGYRITKAADDAAEIGHMPLVDGLDFACNCGKTGCLEQVASATGIARLAGTKNAKEVFDRAKAGDKDMEEVIEKVCSYIGKGLACAAAIADPECFVIGGGVSAAGDYFIDKIKKYYKKQAFHPSIDTAIVKASLLNDAGIYGAAKLAL